jgi:lipopolysaccharide export system protein LptA
MNALCHMKIAGLSAKALSGLVLMACFSGVSSAAEKIAGLTLSGDGPVQIESDKLEVRENENIAIFTGNVAVVQDKTLLKAGKLIVYYADDGGSATTGTAKIERLEATEKVYMKSETQVGTGDAATFNMKTEVLVLTGKQVVLTEGDNIATGCKLTVQMGSGQAQLDGCGRVSMVVSPKSAPKN